MIGLDTNVLVRYFTRDDAKQATLAARLIERDLGPSNAGHISLVTLAELVWVLRTSYDADKDTVIDIVSHLLADPRFAIQHSPSVWAALDAYRSLAVDFSDALIAALDRAAGCLRTVTFDRSAARIDGIVLLT